MEIVTKEVARMRDSRAGDGDSFYAQSGGRPVFNPGNPIPFTAPRTEAVPRRVGRNPVKTLVAWTLVLTVLAVVVKLGYPVVMDRLHQKELSALTADLQSVAGGEESYQRVYGAYTNDLPSLSIPGTVNHIEIRSASTVTFCLVGRSIAGSRTLYFTPVGGVSDRSCG